MNGHFIQIKVTKLVRRKISSIDEHMGNRNTQALLMGV